MMAITTNNSISVKARAAGACGPARSDEIKTLGLIKNLPFRRFHDLPPPSIAALVLVNSIQPMGQPNVHAVSYRTT
jgi:hypothetical protein